MLLSKSHAIRSHRANTLQHTAQQILNRMTRLAIVSSSTVIKKSTSSYRSAANNYRVPPSSPETKYWVRSRDSYNFGFGSLELEQQYSSCEDDPSAEQDPAARRIAIAFVPALWFSWRAFCATFDYTIDATLMFTPLGVTLRPQIINSNPNLVNAVYAMNVHELKILFQAGEARSTDMIVHPIIGEPVSLLDVSLPRLPIFVLVLIT